MQARWQNTICDMLHTVKLWQTTQQQPRSSSKWPTKKHIWCHSMYCTSTQSNVWTECTDCDEDGLVWIQPMHMNFLLQHFNTQPVPESDWHLLQQLVSVGFKFYILLDFTNISKIFSEWSTDISLSPSLVQTPLKWMDGWYTSGCTSIIQLMESLKTHWEGERMTNT